MEFAKPSNYLEILDLKLKWENGKIMVDVHSKPTNSFTYILPTTCYPRKSINSIPHKKKKKGDFLLENTFTIYIQMKF